MATPLRQSIVVLLGPVRTRWPEPLGTALELGDLELVCVSSIHEAAVTMAGSGMRVRALVIDPGTLSASDVSMIRILRKRAATPMMMLPVTASASPSVRHAEELGIVAWAEAVRVFAGVNAEELSGEAGSRSETDNSQALPIETLIENSVTSAIEPRYDEQQPILTEEEMKALLGTLE